MISRLRNLFNPQQPPNSSSLDDLKILSGRTLANLNSNREIKHLADSEYKVFSQWGDDGIIQHLINRIGDVPKKFIEFGVEHYTEANTRFLIMNNNWRGLIIDGSAEHIEHIKKQHYYWRFDLTAVHSFITRDNINSIFRDNNFIGKVGLLSIDIDGNDYWVWEAIDCVDAEIVIVEYNSVFGPDLAVSIPYDEAFYRTNAHYSNLYWGASLAALVHLGNKKGFTFIGCNSNGNNAYFIRQSRNTVFPECSVKEGFVESAFRESRDRDGNLTYISGTNRLALIKDMNVVDVITGKTLPIKGLYKL
jgi:hypothetical protein